MKQAPEYAVVYDVSDDRERRRVDRVLKGYGFRVQKSVFECKLTRASRRTLVDALGRLDIKTGAIKIYRIYGGAAHVVIGKPVPDRDEEFAYVF